MDFDLPAPIVDYVRPLYLDLDGVSHLAVVERVGRIARAIWLPPTERQRRFYELLILFHGLEAWLGKVGNRSRTLLALRDELSSSELAEVTNALRHLDEPRDEAESSLASAIRLEQAGVLGIVTRIERARRDGTDAREIALAEIERTEDPAPSWMPEQARLWLAARMRARREVCEQIVRELEVADLPGDRGDQRESTTFS